MNDTTPDIQEKTDVSISRNEMLNVPLELKRTCDQCQAIVQVCGEHKVNSILYILCIYYISFILLLCLQNTYVIFLIFSLIRNVLDVLKCSEYVQNVLLLIKYYKS